MDKIMGTMRLKNVTRDPGLFLEVPVLGISLGMNAHETGVKDGSWDLLFGEELSLGTRLFRLRLLMFRMAFAVVNSIQLPAVPAQKE